MKYRRHLIAALVAPLMTLIAACSQPAHEPASIQARDSPPADFPAATYAQAAAHGQRVLQVDSAHSLLVITVRRGGTLARLGHDHVVASHALQGFVQPDQGRADLFVALDKLSVDEPALRAQAGLDSQPSTADIAATRANMLDKVLQTSQFPFARIHVQTPPNATGEVTLALDLTLHGVTRSLSVPAQLRDERDGLHINGELSFDQSNFGITPFSILGGAIKVQDKLELCFEVQANERLTRAPQL